MSSQPIKEILSLIPLDTIYKYHIIPLSLENGKLKIGVTQPPDPSVLRDIAFLTGKQIITIIMDTSEISTLIDQYYPTSEEISVQKVSLSDKDLKHQKILKKNHKKPVIGEGSVVQQINGIIHQAINIGASDIHIEPYETFFRVRHRLDGVLQTIGELSLSQKDAVISRLKIMAELDIAEKRRPQDGRIRITKDEKSIDIRVSSLPTDFGEKVVLRILDKSHLNLDLEVLGFDGKNLKAFRRAIHVPYGMILVTGPTGSGKTTTLYAALNELNSPEVNITTIEDPIEYNLSGINQTHVRSDIGFTFAKALRAFLRQDPNIIMVGEIRDTETAEIAIRAALTGHLVLSTLHTNDAPSTISRLIDMGIEPFLVSSSVRLIMAQRLVRKVCDHCKTKIKPDPAVLEELQVKNGMRTCYAGSGCEHCNGTGYRGRTALYEVMPISEQLSDMVVHHANAYDLKRQAKKEGMRTLREIAIEKIKAGITTPQEALRETTL